MRLLQGVLLPTALEIAQGLSYLHSDECRLVHCDLSCSNILLTSLDEGPRGFRALLSDFGESHAGGRGRASQELPSCLSQPGGLATRTRHGLLRTPPPPRLASAQRRRVWRPALHLQA
jgi:serine/threonine protein kinase